MTSIPLGFYRAIIYDIIKLLNKYFITTFYDICASGASILASVHFEAVIVFQYRDLTAC